MPSSRTSADPSADARVVRQAALRRRLAEEGFDGLLVRHPANVRYLTGFTGSAGVLLVSLQETFLITDFRYAEQAPEEVEATAQVDVVESDVWERFGQRARDSSSGTLGFEQDAMSVGTAQRLADLRLPAELKPIAGFVETLRLRKSASEVASIREAARLAADAFDTAVGAIRPGVTEQAVAAELERALRIRGSEWHPFPTIVASGPRSARPHARTSHREILTGDLVLLDFGAQVDGYCADLTRMVVVGRADDRQRMVHDLVREAQHHARAHVRAGMTGQEADRLARGIIEARGFGDAFGHSLGHGLGLEVHEAPRLSRTNTGALPADAVVTIEPGVYFAGWGGIRLEDDVWLNDAGAVLLSDGRTELREL